MVTGVVTFWLSCIMADLAVRLARSSIARVVHLARHCFKTWWLLGDDMQFIFSRKSISIFFSREPRFPYDPSFLVYYIEVDVFEIDVFGIDVFWDRCFLG